MEHDRSKKNGDRHPPEDGADSAGIGRCEYPVGINGVEITVPSETGRVKARKLLESAEQANALMTELDEKTILEDDDRIYEGDDEVDLQKSRFFIAIQSMRERKPCLNVFVIFSRTIRYTVGVHGNQEDMGDGA